jgi:hypothetical protein
MGRQMVSTGQYTSQYSPTLYAHLYNFTNDGHITVQQDVTMLDIANLFDLPLSEEAWAEFIILQ